MKRNDNLSHFIWILDQSNESFHSKTLHRHHACVQITRLATKAVHLRKFSFLAIINWTLTSSIKNHPMRIKFTYNLYRKTGDALVCRYMNMPNDVMWFSSAKRYLWISFDFFVHEYWNNLCEILNDRKVGRCIFFYWKVNISFSAARNFYMCFPHCNFVLRWLLMRFMLLLEFSPFTFSYVSTKVSQILQHR